MSEIGLKVFSATKARDRELLGETITEWIRHHLEHEVFEKIVTQSFRCRFLLPGDHDLLSRAMIYLAEIVDLGHALRIADLVLARNATRLAASTW